MIRLDRHKRKTAINWNAVNNGLFELFKNIRNLDTFLKIHSSSIDEIITTSFYFNNENNIQFNINKQIVSCFTIKIFSYDILAINYGTFGQDIQLNLFYSLLFNEVLACRLR